MQRFFCEHCGHEVEFQTATCPVCGTPLGYVPSQQAIRKLIPEPGGASYGIAGEDTAYWRCLNAAWSCNWVLPAATGASWCRSCALTRGRPDEGRPDAIEAWSRAEAGKRRVVHQLDRLGLPVEPRTPATPAGLVFDLVYLPGERGLTGHLDGVVTLDLAEADDGHRDELRILLGEPYRTLLGNLRHEIAHHYWHRLVGESDHLDRFRVLFGDERADYAAALERYYGRDEAVWDADRFVSGYAQAHPHEDWAETFAHYLHIDDALDTAAAHGLVDRGADPDGGASGGPDAAFALVLQRWRPIARAVDAIAGALGSPRVYPFDPQGAVVDKLEFVHARVTAPTDAGRALPRLVDPSRRVRESQS
ncbi:MAG: putative zinc-binding metallopeptidase [Ilumatobacteraceae bacterium]